MGQDFFTPGNAIQRAKDEKAAARDALNASKEASANSLALQTRMYDQQRADYQPYQDLGYQGLEGLKNYQDTSPTYDQSVTDRLAAYNYEEDPGTAAAKALGQKNLSQQLAARGLNYGSTGAEAGAELSQKYDVQGYDKGYDKYRASLTDRYNALRGESGQGYDRLMNMVKVGQGAASSAGSAAQNFSTAGAANINAAGQNQAAGILGAQQNASNNSAAFGQGITDSISTGLKAYQTGREQGWFSGSSGGTSDFSGRDVQGSDVIYDS